MEPIPTKDTDGGARFTFNIEVPIAMIQEDVFDLFPILSYVSPYWPVHVGECIREQGFPLELVRANEILQSETTLTRCWALYNHEAPLCSVVDVGNPGPVSRTYELYKDACVRYASGYSIVTDRVPPLYAAIFFEWLPVVRWMLDHDLLYQGDQSVSSPLQLALQKRLPVIVRALMDAGCSVNSVAKCSGSTRGATVIQTAAEVGDPDTIKMLAKPLEHLPESLFKAWSGPATYLACGRVGKGALEAIFSTLTPPYDALWLQQALQEILWFVADDGDEGLNFLINKAKEIFPSSGSIVPPRGMAFAARHPELFEKLVPISAPMDERSLNITICELAMCVGKSMEIPADEFMSRVTLQLLRRTQKRVTISNETFACLSILGYRKTLLLIFLLEEASNPGPEPHSQVSAFRDRVATTTLLHPGLIDDHYERYPGIVEELFAAISDIPFRGELGCYLADWIVVSHTIADADLSPPILVLDPPAVVMWEAEPKWDSPEDNDKPRAWGMKLIPHGLSDGNIKPSQLRLNDSKVPLWKFVCQNIETHGCGHLGIGRLFDEGGWKPRKNGHPTDVWLCRLDSGSLIELRIGQSVRVARRGRDGMSLYSGAQEGVLSMPSTAEWRKGVGGEEQRVE